MSLSTPEFEFFFGEPPPTKEQVRELEAFIAAPLPPDFLAFLDRAHGAGISPADVDVEEFLVTMNYSQILTVPKMLDQTKFLRDAFDVPAQVLLFARDGIGSFVCLDLSEDDYGAVVAYVKPLPAQPEEEGSGFSRLCGSFSEYLDMLYEGDSEE